MNNDYLESMNKLARKRQLTLTKQQEKEIYIIYKNAAINYTEKFVNATPGTATKALYAEYAHNLAYKLQDIINEYSIKAAQDVSDMVAKLTEQQFYDSFGLDVPPHLKGKSAVAQLANVMANKSAQQLVLGSIYKDGKGLSSRIWRSVNSSCQKIEDVIAQCMAQQLSAVEMSKVLGTFLNPGETTEWDRKRIRQLLGPGYAAWNKNVSYEALRLARTTINHSATIGLKHSAKLNPYLSKCIWHSVHAIGRTCELCEERDGQVFTIAKLPFDHPNGLCYNEPVLDKPLDKIADELKAWVNGKPNQRLKEWEIKLKSDAKQLGLPWGNKKASPVKVAQPKKVLKVYTRDDINELSEYSKDWISKLSEDEREAVTTYTGSAYRSMNGYLRGIRDDTQYKKEIKNLSIALNKYQMKEDTLVFRGSDLDMLSHIGFGDVYEKMLDYSYDAKELEAIKKGLEGQVLVDKGFMSTAAVSGSNFDMEMLFNIKVEKDFKGAAFVKELSRFASENELLLDKGTGLFIENVTYSTTDRRWVIDAKAIR